MKRLAPILLTVLLLVPTVPVASAQEESIGSYPTVVRDHVADLIDSAEEDAWPRGEPAHPNATDELEQARANLSAGRVGTAIQKYIDFRVRNAVNHLFDDLQSTSPDRGRERIASQTNSFRSDAIATIPSYRQTANGIDASNLTIRGLETAVWGTTTAARGELLVNILPQVSTSDTYSNRTPIKTAIETRFAFSLGAQLRMAIGSSIASLAPQVGGPSLEAGEQADRLEELANQRVVFPGRSQIKQYLPRGNGTEDTALLRTGLLMVSMEQSKVQEMQRIFLEALGRKALKAPLNDALDHDLETLAPWARAGSPLALDGWETVDYDVEEEVTQRTLQPVLEDRAKARTAIAAEQILAPNATAENGAPGVGMGAALLVVAMTGALLAPLRRDP